eukprot:7164578-Pyramimonas_sp.AAC.1
MLHSSFPAGGLPPEPPPDGHAAAGAAGAGAGALSPAHWECLAPATPRTRATHESGRSPPAEPRAVEPKQQRP